MQLSGSEPAPPKKRATIPWGGVTWRWGHPWEVCPWLKDWLASSLSPCEWRADEGGGGHGVMHEIQSRAGPCRAAGCCSPSPVRAGRAGAHIPVCTTDSWSPLVPAPWPCVDDRGFGETRQALALGCTAGRPCHAQHQASGWGMPQEGDYGDLLGGLMRPHRMAGQGWVPWSGLEFGLWRPRRPHAAGESVCGTLMGFGVPRGGGEPMLGGPGWGSWTGWGAVWGCLGWGDPL